MRITAPLPILLAGGLATAVLAAEAPASLQKAFGNTIISTYPDGRTGLLWLKADGTYTAKGRRRTPSSGAWSVKGERICLKQLKPSRAPINYCTPLPEGETWAARAVTGEKIKVKLVKGVVEP
jgi:hypothetical protein